MLKLSLIEFFLRLIPEGFLLALSIYAFSGTPLNTKRYLVSASVLSINTYLVRMLPINFGVHTILLLMLYIIVAVNISRIDMMMAIKLSLVATIILSICDFVNLFILVKIFSISIEKLLDDIFTKTILGLPSLGLFFIIVFFFYKRNSKKVEE